MAELELLRSLWHGDQDSCGFWSVSLVMAVCDDLGQPNGPIAVVRALYPDSSPNEVDAEAIGVIEEGFQWWVQRKKMAA